jgi:hypothetical protein
MGDAFLVQKSGVVYSDFVEATGGSVTFSGDFKIHTFTTSGSFTVTSIPEFNNTVEYLVVAGGGGGINDGGSGGGGGGYLEGTNKKVFVKTYQIQVGAGGTSGASSSNGGDSIFDDIKSFGGGRGSNGNGVKYNGGSAGGHGSGNALINYSGSPTIWDTSGKSDLGVPGQGNAGGKGLGRDQDANNSGYQWRGAGGGGRGSAGSNGRGGDARASAISGTSMAFSGGGGGFGHDLTGPSIQGGENAGNGGSVTAFPYTSSRQPPTSAAINRGGGGGGDHPGRSESTSGGSGIVIIRYRYR